MQSNRVILEKVEPVASTPLLGDRPVPATYTTSSGANSASTRIPNPFQLLPGDLLLIILEQLPAIDAVRVARVDRVFKAISDDNILWKKKAELDLTEVMTTKQIIGQTVCDDRIPGIRKRIYLNTRARWATSPNDIYKAYTQPVLPGFTRYASTSKTTMVCISSAYFGFVTLTVGTIALACGLPWGLGCMTISCLSGATCGSAVGCIVYQDNEDIHQNNLAYDEKVRRKYEAKAASEADAETHFGNRANFFYPAPSTSRRSVNEEPPAQLQMQLG